MGLNQFSQVIVKLFEEAGVEGGGGCSEFETEWAWTRYGDGGVCDAADCLEESCDVACKFGGGREVNVR